MSDLVTPLRVEDSFRIENGVEMVSIVNGDGLWEFDCYKYNQQPILERLNKYEHLQQRIKELEQQVSDAEASFDLQWKAGQRAIKMWQGETGKTMQWPDKADLCVWLMNKLEQGK